MYHLRNIAGTALLGMFLATGCYRGIDAIGAADGDGGSGGDGGADGGGTGADGSGGDGSEAEVPAPTTRFFRLTHRQWENTVRDLLYLDEPTGLSDSFRPDPVSSGFLFDNNALSLEIDNALWERYRLAAVQIAEQVVADPSLEARIVPPDEGDDAARAAEFVETFGRRAYRRPLSEQERRDLLDQFEGAAGLYTGLSPFDAGVRHVIETVLQSPYFLYRIERSTEPDGEVIPLTDWEVASRLSYFLWNTMPDDPLFDLAASGTLTEPQELELVAHDMLEDPRAEAVVNRFHHQLLEVEKFAAAEPSPEFFPDVSPGFGEAAVMENELFLHEIVFGQDGSWADVLTSNETFVNDELAAIYGLEGEFDDSFQRVSLDPGERRGLFTQVGFLAANASSVNPDPIHRGVFLAKRIGCMVIAAPPDGATEDLPDPEPDQTNREYIEAITEQPGSACASCHSTMINPMGFPFEYYDAVGAFRTTDNGKPVDGSANAFIGAEQAHVENAIELIEALAASSAVHECYVKHWIEFAQGRPFAPEDRALTVRLGEESLTDGSSIKELLVGLVTSKPFLTRATEELE